MIARDLARQAIGEKAILDAAAELNATTRQALADAMEAGDRLTVGTIGSVTLSAPKGTHKVTDRAAFVRWMQDHQPAAVVMVPTVVPAVEKTILTRGCTDTGEIPDGIDLVAGNPVLSVRPTQEARAAARALIVRELEA